MRAFLLHHDAAEPRDPMKTEEALRLTQFLLDRAGEGAFWADPDGRFFYVNEAACSMMGYSREEMLALRVPDILAPEASGLFQELSRSVRAKGEAVRPPSRRDERAASSARRLRTATCNFNNRSGRKTARKLS